MPWAGRCQQTVARAAFMGWSRREAQSGSGGQPVAQRQGEIEVDIEREREVDFRHGNVF